MAYEISACLVGSEMCIRDSLEVEVRPGGAPGAAGEGDNVSRLHRLSHFCQQFGAVAV